MLSRALGRGKEVSRRDLCLNEDCSVVFLPRVGRKIPKPRAQKLNTTTDIMFLPNENSSVDGCGKHSVSSSKSPWFLPLYKIGWRFESIFKGNSIINWTRENLRFSTGRGQENMSVCPEGVWIHNSRDMTDFPVLPLLLNNLFAKGRSPPVQM